MPSKAKINELRSKRQRKNTTQLPNTTTGVIDENTAHINNASELWQDIKKRVRDDTDFVSLPDSKKIEIYQKSEFKDFYTNFPIVCRYMICMGQFSMKAFKRFLKKTQNMLKLQQEQRQSRPITEKPKTNSEDEWVKRQADYVRYLWEAYQKSNFSTIEAQRVWQHAYTTLTKEFSDFKDLHKEIEEKLKVDGKTNKSEVVREMLSRVANEEQSFDEKTNEELIIKLNKQVIAQRRRNLLQQIKNDVETMLPTRITRGEVKEPNST